MIPTPVRLAGTATLLFACHPGPSPNPTVPPKKGPSPKVRCRENIESAPLATLDQGSCPVVLIGDGTYVRLGDLAPQPTVGAVGTWPRGCEPTRCRFEIEATDVGLVVWAETSGQRSEVPGGVWIGIVADNRLGWIDLWLGAGEPEVVGGTEAGPTHALSAERCAGGVRLQVVARLPGGAHVEVPPGLGARIGDYAVGPAGDMVVTARALKDCVPVRPP